MIKKITRLILRYVTLGIDENTSLNDRKKITLLHIFCNTWHLLSILSFIEDFYDDRLKVISYPIMIALVIGVQTLLNYKKLHAASYVFLTSMIGVTFFFSNYLYQGEMFEYYLLLGPAIALIYIDDKRMNITILIICLLVLYVPNYYFHHYPTSLLNNLNPPFLVYTNFIIVSYFKDLNIRNEKILKAKTHELEQLDKFKSQFFTNISHEIRTPLTLINGQVSELKQGKAYSDSPLKNIKKQINIITDMVDNVLDLAKMKSSSFSLQLRPSNVSDLMQKQYLNFYPLFQQKGLGFDIYKDDVDFIANIDPIFFERAVNNILINALKYTEDGYVKINITEHKKTLLVSISDTGIGISPEESSSVFNRFYQVNNDINKAGGSGVGLAFSKEIIEMHHGTISLDSELTKGSQFIIKIPYETVIPRSLEKIEKPTNNDQENDESIDLVKTPKSTFLIVEDNFDMRKYLVSILDTHQCLEAANGLEALDILAERSVDFIITDYMMPKLDGREFVHELKKTTNDIPIIMLTAKTDADSKLEMLRLGIDDYVTKPFEKEELLARVNNSLSNNAVRKEYNNEQKIKGLPIEDGFIQKLRDFIYDRSSDTTLNQEIISNEFSLSKSSFYRRVKSQTGLTPNNLIKEVRLQKAREILEQNPEILLKQLAAQVGFSHQTYFSKIFTQRFGHKPCVRTD